MSLTERLLKNTTSKLTSTLSDSKVFSNSDEVTTPIPLVNLALSGRIDGGLTSGLGLIAGPSRHFKSNLMLLIVAAYLKKYPDAVCLFYDSEFGAKEDYFKSFGIDPSRVVHTPITNVEELKFDLMAQIAHIERSDKVIIAVDSIGNLASKKEVDDALDQKSVADMTRAKAIKSLFRMVTPHLTLKDIPMLTVNHVYMTTEMFAKTVISGGTGLMYSSDWAFIIGRAQEKDDKEIAGYKFTINVEKSRFVKEKSKLPLTVYFDGGIKKWSGMLDLALETGHVIKPKNGWYTRPSVPDDKNYREAETHTSAFWNPIIMQTDFAQVLEKKFKLGNGGMMVQEERDDETED